MYFMSLLKSLFNDFKTWGYWTFKGPYSPKNFWEKWGETFINEPIQRKLYPEHKWLVKTLKRHQPTSFLEIGCGFGRNLKLIRKNFPALHLTGIDLGYSFLNHASTFLNPSSFTNLIQGSATNLPFSNDAFDCTLSHGLLMHVKPAKIHESINELYRVTRKYALVFEQNDRIAPLNNKHFRKINYYTFTYPYKKLFEQHGFVIINYHRYRDLDWFTLKK